MKVIELVQRFAALEASVAEEKGPFALFALFMREEVPDRWDLIVSAPWLGDDRQAAVAYLVVQIKSRLGAQELINLTRIVVIDPENEALQNLNRVIQTEHGTVEVADSEFFGVLVKRAFIITSKRPPLATVK
jgi:hypothetical protein